MCDLVDLGQTVTLTLYIHEGQNLMSGPFLIFFSTKGKITASLNLELVVPFGVAWLA